MIQKKKVSRIDYAQFLLASQKNYTLTYFDDHREDISHNAINRYLVREKLTPSLLWEHVSGEIVQILLGRIVFDDTVLDKDSSEAIELVKWQYSGNSKQVIRGIGVVRCFYYNPEVDRYWALDYRIYALDEDGKSKLDHGEDMLRGAIFSKILSFDSALMDSWYATHHLMLTIDSLSKKFDCPLKTNRLVSRVD